MADTTVEWIANLIVYVCVSNCKGLAVGAWILIAYHILDSEEHIFSNSSLAVWLKQCLARTHHTPNPTRHINVQ